jgi:DNA polymerase/3'-5' exonuclease PolX
VKLSTAEMLAGKVRDLLAPACAEALVVGSVRRKKPNVHDIEIACRPLPARPVFGEVRSAVNALEARIAELLWLGELAKHPEPAKRKDGLKLKCLWLPDAGGIQVDLFIADPSGDNWGNTVAIRTGDYAFSRLMVTPRRAGGLMPKGMRQDDGYLWRGETRIPCASEGEYFAALGIDEPPPPYQRDERAALQLRRELARERARA